MFDLKAIRENPADFDAAWGRRGLEPQTEAILRLDERRRAVQTELQAAQGKRNESAKAIGKAKASGDEDAANALIAEVADLKATIQQGEEEDRSLGEQLEAILYALPNLPHKSAPDGADESENVIIREVGTPPEFSFEAREHFDIGEALGQMDFEVAAKLSGSRFVVLRGGLARLERALGQFMIDLQTGDHGYTEVQTPAMVRADALIGTGQLPKFEEDQFKTDTDHYLIPTAEVTLTNLARESILNASDLPMRVTALTQCFRSEAGAAGKDTRGMIRQHQFNKVELVSIVHPDQSNDELERKTGCAEEVLKRLGLPYRVIELCTGDLGFGSQKTYDLEVWLPGQGQYREISSCSSCGDFQARRMRARFRPEGEKQTQFVHTLNGSGLAVGRALVAVLENYQQEDGSVHIPDILQPYMGGMTKISAS